jgi:hypothetical protein
VYAQHQHYFDEQLDDICPREAFTRDLCKEIDVWLEQGEQLVIALDANEDMRNGSVAAAFQARNLREVLLARHGRNAPPTTDNGSTVIDGIWATPSIVIEGGVTWLAGKDYHAQTIGAYGLMLHMKQYMGIGFRRWFDTQYEGSSCRILEWCVDLL